MLQKLRDKTSGWIATCILGLLMIPFLFVIDARYIGGIGENNIALIQAPPAWWSSAPHWWPVSLFWQRREVGMDAFQDRFNQLRMQQREKMKDAFDAAAFDTKENKLRVLNQLIDEQVLSLAALRAHIVVFPKDLYRAIAEIPSFQVNGEFNKDLYLAALAAMNPPRTPVVFQQMMADALITSFIPDSLSGSSFYLLPDLVHIFQLVGQKRDVQMVVLPADSTQSPPPVSPESIANWYQTHQSDYVRPAEVWFDAINLNEANVPKIPTPDDAVLRQRYDSEKNRFVAPETRHAEHILIAVSSPSEDAAAKRKAEEIAQRLRSPNADFSALARQYSDDTGSKESGGDLGWVSKGTMDANFEKELFSLAPGQVSPPVRTQYGYHIIKLLAIKGGGQSKSFEEVKPQLLQEYNAAELEKRFNALIGKIVDSIDQGHHSLTDIAKQMDLPVQHIGPVSAQTTGATDNPLLVQAAFASSRLQNMVSDPIKIAPMHTAFVQATRSTPKTQLPLDSVRPRIIAAINLKFIEDANQKAANTVLQHLQHDHISLESFAKDKNLQLRSLPSLARMDPEPSISAQNAIFALSVPPDGQAMGIARMDDGKYAVFRVNKVIPGAVPSIEQQYLIANQLNQLYGNLAVKQYVSALRSQYQVKIDSGSL